MMVVQLSGRKACQGFTVERIGRSGSSFDDVALVELEFYFSGYIFLCSADSSYSRDRNLWHISHEGLELEDPSCEPNYDHLLVLGVSPQQAPEEGEYVSMTFESGVPKTINGKSMKVADIIRELNRLGGKHGIGIIDIVENRVVGMKSRGVYETPGGTILMEAQQQLEELVLDRATMEVKKDLANKLAQIVYEGGHGCSCCLQKMVGRCHAPCSIQFLLPVTACSTYRFSMLQ